jgi:hypothetical protein
MPKGGNRRRGWRMTGRKFDPNTALVFEDGSAPPAHAGKFHYPESIHGIVPQLSELVSERSWNPGWFSGTVPMCIEHIVGFFDVVHVMHERAQAVLADYGQNKHPYCLYLRSFAAAGHRGEAPPSGGKQLLALTRGDLDFRNYLSDHLRGVLPVISCFNTLDMVGLATARQSPGAKPAILRLLSHTWKRTVAALIDNARVIVLHIWPTMHGNATAGVETEMWYLHKLEQTQRCLLVLTTDNPVPRHGEFDFRAAFGWPAAKTDQDFSDELTTLARDDFRRQSLQSVFPDLPCYVIDRNIEPALEQFRNDDLSAISYTNFIPRSLKPNFDLINTEYPEMVTRWTAIEERMRASRAVGENEIAYAMLVALSCFVLATTLEHYEPMARAIATVGIAHRLLTRDDTLERVCLDGAAKFARWGGMEDLAAYFAKASAESDRPEQVPFA